jgi:hypothetical protein
VYRDEKQTKECKAARNDDIFLNTWRAIYVRLDFMSLEMSSSGVMKPAGLKKVHLVITEENTDLVKKQWIQTQAGGECACF